MNLERGSRVALAYAMDIMLAAASSAVIPIQLVATIDAPLRPLDPSPPGPDELDVAQMGSGALLHLTRIHQIVWRAPLVLLSGKHAPLQVLLVVLPSNAGMLLGLQVVLTFQNRADTASNPLSPEHCTRKLEESTTSL